jgi:multisubunit Na+/H+ antiporter MnhG subunit
MDTNELAHPASWIETLVALGPTSLFPLVFLMGVILTPFLKGLKDPAPGLGIAFAVIGMILIAMVAGWVKNFPRWVFPYWGFALLISLYVYEFTGTMAGQQVRGDWWAWMPLAGVILVGSLWARSLRPVSALLNSVWRDWTLLSFTVYGALPLLFIAAYDEVHNEGPILTLIMLILVAGTIGYMRTENIWHRFACLVGGFTLGWAVLMVHQAIYWNGRQEVWMPAPGSWKETLNWTSRSGAILMLILVAPVLIELLRRAIISGRIPKTAG